MLSISSLPPEPEAAQVARANVAWGSAWALLSSLMAIFIAIPQHARGHGMSVYDGFVIAYTFAAARAFRKAAIARRHELSELA